MCDCEYNLNDWQQFVVVKLRVGQKTEMPKRSSLARVPDFNFWRGTIFGDETASILYICHLDLRLVNEKPVASVEALEILRIISSSNEHV